LVLESNYKIVAMQLENLHALVQKQQADHKNKEARTKAENSDFDRVWYFFLIIQCSMFSFYLLAHEGFRESRRTNAPACGGAGVGPHSGR